VSKTTRPYFIWNADLTEEDVRRILAEGSDYSRVQLMSTILQVARFEDIWKYLSPRDVQKWFWQIRWRDADVREHWKHALTLWGYPPDECPDPVAARLSV
jgi:hypothetical protein